MVPFELTNVAADSANAGLLPSLQQQLAAWCKQQGDGQEVERLGEVAGE